MTRRAKKEEMETFLEEPDYSSIIDTDGFTNHLTEEDAFLVRTLIPVPEDPYDELGAKMADRLQRDLAANFEVLDRYEDFKRWLEQKRTELRRGFNYTLNTDAILKRYESSDDNLGTYDASLKKNLPNLIKDCEKTIKDHESSKTLSDAEKKGKIQGVQGKIDNMRGTIRGLIKKGIAKGK